MSSSNSGTVEESPFEDGDAPVPTSPFARRMSFGARAMQNMRTATTGNGNANGRSSVSKAKSPPAANHSRGLSCSYRNDVHSHVFVDRYANFSSSTAGQGYDFAENLRNRAERSSIAGASGPPQSPPMHQRAKSVSVMEPPVKEMPKQPKRPDAFQERILKGDFYMD